MEHISDLSNIGENKRCLIVGGGNSLNRFEWDKLEDIYVICLNNHLSQMADMIVYYDKDMMEHFENHEIPSETLLLGFKHRENTINHTCDRCTHYYNYKDIVHGDTGFHALQFADGVFNFNQIYLIGFDYCHDGDSYHHNETNSDPIKIKEFERWSMNIVLGRYKDIRWKNKIYNCSDKSALKLFNYGVPY